MMAGGGGGLGALKNMFSGGAGDMMSAMNSMKKVKQAQ